MNSKERMKIEGEPEKKKEDFTSIRRVLGRKYEDISEEEKREMMESMEETFRNQKKFKEDLVKEFGSEENIPDILRTIFYEREKTPEEIKIIDLANQKTNKLREKFGLPELSIPLENIYVIPREAPWPRDIEYDNYYIQISQNIIIREARVRKLRDSKTIFAERVIHEMIHFKSYKSLKTLENLSAVGAYRIGLHTYKRKNSSESYFNNINEAIVEELTIRLLKELEEHPLFRDETIQTKKLKKLLAKEKSDEGKYLIKGDELYINFDQGKSILSSAYFANEKEREVLNILIEKTFQKNKNKFKNKEEVFSIFVEATITGKMIFLGNLVDKTFGRGVFRKIAQIDTDVDKLKEYVRNLK